MSSRLWHRTYTVERAKGHDEKAAKLLAGVACAGYKKIWRPGEDAPPDP